MTSPKFLFLLLTAFLFAACGSRLSGNLDRTASTVSTKNEPRQQAQLRSTTAQVSLAQADQSLAAAEASNRKIIRDANLTIEVSDPSEAQRKITSIAESLGGFVVTSESKTRQISDAKQELEVDLVARVPASQFSSGLEQIRGTGNRVVQEKLTGNDVTEEFIDIEARAKTQKALEDQFLEIMKRANKVEDALEVQRQIAEVRTEIEKLEGRKRFLDNRASLSTIAVNLRSPIAIAVNTSGFGRRIKESLADSAELAGDIVLFLSRSVIMLIPVFVLLILPGWVIGRFVWRRIRKSGLALKQPESQLDAGNA